MSQPIGPNVRRLMIERASQIAVERANLRKKSEGQTGEFALAGQVAGRIADGGILQDMKDALEWTKKALALVRSAPDADPSWTDEDIAGDILARADKRRRPYNRNQEET